ncbi:983_t:CDS:2, partial [Cetraspora pellucida]
MQLQFSQICELQLHHSIDLFNIIFKNTSNASSLFLKIGSAAAGCHLGTAFPNNSYTPRGYTLLQPQASLKVIHCQGYTFRIVMGHHKEWGYWIDINQ